MLLDVRCRFELFCIDKEVTGLVCDGWTKRIVRKYPVAAKACRSQTTTFGLIRRHKLRVLATQSVRCQLAGLVRDMDKSILRKYSASARHDS